MAENGDEALPAVTIQAVGTARGNPGLSGAGIVIVDGSGAVCERVARYLGSMAALEAQVQALMLALRYARPYAPAPLHLLLGNETVARQLSGEMPARHPILLRALAELEQRLAPFASVTYRVGTADEMEEAERLANMGIDTRLRPMPAFDRPPPD